MRINGLRINNVLGVRSVDVRFQHPVALFAGRNYAGKSSLQAAIRMALLGEPERVSLKKDFPQLVADGAKDGEVVVVVDDTAVHLPLPEGKPTPWTTRPAHLAFCLSPERFAQLDSDARRTFLFKLTALQTDGQAVMKRLVDKGCEPKYVEGIGEPLKRGFPAAHAHAAEQARDAKGAWRGATGETWGKDKAGAWKPAQGALFGKDEGEILARVQRDYAQAIEEASAAGKDLSALEARADTPDLGGDPAKAAQVTKLEEFVQRVQAERAAVERDIANENAVVDAPNGIACPHCGGLVVQDGFALKPFTGADSAGKQGARAKLQKLQGDLRRLNETLRSHERDLADCREHAAKVAAGKEVKAKAPGVHELTKAKDRYVVAQDKLRSLREEEARLVEARNEAQRASEAKARADRHHAEVLGWLAIADAVAPDGIPAEILAGALDPFNKKLQGAAVQTGWKQTKVNADMSITADGRPYHLLSESERWRADTVLAYAIASYGPRFLLLDRLDVLDLNGRGEALAWIVALVNQKRLDGAIVCGTLKAVPKNYEGVDAFWLESGQVLELERAA